MFKIITEYEGKQFEKIVVRYYLFGVLILLKSQPIRLSEFI